MALVRVIGAGIVGISCAVALRKAGFDVVLMDREEPARRASSWNAGVLATSSLIPLNNPGIFARIPGLLTGRVAGFSLNRDRLFSNLKWGLSFLGKSRRAEALKSIDMLNRLIKLSMSEHQKLATESDAESCLQNGGWLFGFSDRAGAGKLAFHREIYDQFDVEVSELDRDQLTAMEPGLTEKFQSALLFPGSRFVSEPHQLARKYFDYFLALGGSFEKFSVSRIESDREEAVAISSEGGRLAADQLVLAAGPWSAELLKSLGPRLPMISERGYVARYSLKGNAVLNRPVYDVEGGVVLSPRPEGVQVSTGTELAHVDSPPANCLLETAKRRARELLPLGDELAGFEHTADRPSLPDGLPAIGRVQGVNNLWLCCGHQHVGFSTGPGSANILVSEMTGRGQQFNVAGLAPERFGI